MNSRVFGITGWKNSGKTGLMERLIHALSGRGWRVVAVKHAHHDFDIDHPGTDSHRHRMAGAREVAIVSTRRLARIRELTEGEEPTLDEVVAQFDTADIILVEGYKNATHPKIECRRSGARDTTPLEGRIPRVVAIASDFPVKDTALPVFELDATTAIADFIERQLGGTTEKTHRN